MELWVGGRRGWGEDVGGAFHYTIVHAQVCEFLKRVDLLLSAALRNDCAPQTPGPFVLLVSLLLLRDGDLKELGKSWEELGPGNMAHCVARLVMVSFVVQS